MAEDYLTTRLGTGYKGKIERILKFRPELNSTKRVIESALDFYYEWCVTFSEKEQALMQKQKLFEEIRTPSDRARTLPPQG